MIDWTSNDTEVLLNPRLPESEGLRLRRLVKDSPSFNAHIWLATSGSSGRIKMVALSKDAFLASAASANRHMETSNADRWGLVLPRFHVGGLSIFARAFLSHSEVLELPKWSAPDFAGWCTSEKVTLSSLVSAQLTDLVRMNLRAPAHLRAVLLGGGGVSKDLYSRARALGWNILPTYGMTECGSQVATAPVNSLLQEEYPELMMLPHLEARVETDGRLAFRGSSLLTGYAFEEVSGVARFEDPKRLGWFISEDQGEVKTGPGGARQLLLLKGRGTDFIKIGGESVGLPRLDQALEKVWNDLYSTAQVGWDAALVAYPDERLGSVIHLVVAGASESFVEQIVEAFNSEVLPFEKIRAVHRLPELPRSSLGKILRPEILKTLGVQRT